MNDDRNQQERQGPENCGLEKTHALPGSLSKRGITARCLRELPFRETRLRESAGAPLHVTSYSKTLRRNSNGSACAVNFRRSQIFVQGHTRSGSSGVAEKPGLENR